ncbi:AbrB/MazE/SpoVT family DNA-binding domain-containing protein [Candidatus Pacearchaeota archaeon]|nr:AbrB/MazE/SpoVT family DNA-binding domain-containing protein [Candidatus Pacearchaeota archaeon]
MTKFKIKLGERGQVVIPKIIRESLGMTKNKTIIIEIENKSIKLTTSEKSDILKSWKEIAEKEGTNISKKFIYGDRLYEKVF